jgi:uncharacterized protein
VITIHTSAMLALLDRKSRYHDRMLAALRAERPPFLVPAATLGELGYFCTHRFSTDVTTPFVHDLRTGSWTLDCGDTDLERVSELVERYTDLPLGLVDAVVAACAERNGGRVLALDRDLEVVAREGRLEVLPAIARSDG